MMNRFTRFLYRAATGVICMGLLLSLFGCKKNPDPPELPYSEPISGGVTDNSDPNAPKEIASKEITSLSLFFQQENDTDETLNGDFRFELTVTEDGRTLLSEKDCYRLEQIEVSGDLPAQTQEIIDRFDLVSLNGKDRITAGLPFPYGPLYLRAEYASGEKLYFQINGDCLWTMSFTKLFRQALSDAGHPEVMPEDDFFAVRNFLLEYPEGDALVCLGTGIPPSESASAAGELLWIIDDAYGSGEEKSNEIFLETYDPAAGVSSGRSGPADERFFSGLSDLLKASDLDLFANSQYFPDSFGESDLGQSPACFHFRITYQDGHSICGYSDVPEDREIFAEIAQTVISFCEPFLTDSRT